MREINRRSTRFRRRTGSLKLFAPNAYIFFEQTLCENTGIPIDFPAERRRIDVNRPRRTAEHGVERPAVLASGAAPLGAAPGQWLRLSLSFAGAQVTAAVNNFRFNESPLDLLRRAGEAGVSEVTLPREWGDWATRAQMPSLRIPDFHMSSVSQAH